MYQQELRTKLDEILNKGLSLSSIAKSTGLSYYMLSRFKNNKIYFVEDDAEKLDKYLSKVYIPTEV